MTDLLTVAARYAHPAAWPVPLRFDPTARWYARLAATGTHQVWALSWLPGQGTGLHDHGGSQGAFLVVAGELTELTVTGGQLGAHRLATGVGRRFGPRHVHMVTNTLDQPAVSVHVYRPALRPSSPSPRVRTRRPAPTGRPRTGPAAPRR
ncbi:cysteine dioxygenase family protein [Micromonospora sp. KC213]|uniref:cysteine dioxygenase n=1 Tax=Micromonospora sp. KC213 TaxID=2530378 RepID=UPI0010501C7C|nr:cysteine dioxygenase family protein [Micromonospora sp. KC213]TDC41224.1 cysteine dioxygenase [Micromonospora sp. KC213]